jgi:hypothetical protein
VCGEPIYTSSDYFSLLVITQHSSHLWSTKFSELIIEGGVEIKCDKQRRENQMNKPRIPTVEEIMNKKRPEKKFRSGAVSATIWSNEGKNDKGESVNYSTISFARNYLDKDGSWQTTNSLRAADLPKAILVLSKAYEHLALADDDTIESEDV